ncbi:hypothetical protein HNR37_000841 [Desulfurispira natronophila]|uniref:Uncharacterized protein n=1 Tax=Desulfurispira natronophila TaxID=682562 RepID=A0A7W7Y3U7_9BACT|nr:hypothetical protein [Desulfurispira natronophila]MBB5021529.1 hypothetical protein [Desulfurispira natronophila]
MAHHHWDIVGSGRFKSELSGIVRNLVSKYHHQINTAKPPRNGVLRPGEQLYFIPSLLRDLLVMRMQSIHASDHCCSHDRLLSGDATGDDSPSSCAIEVSSTVPLSGARCGSGFATLLEIDACSALVRLRLRGVASTALACIIKVLQCAAFGAFYLNVNYKAFE